MSAFQDTSIFQGVVEFTDSEGREFRAQRENSGVYNVSEKADQAFVHIGTIRTQRQASTPKAIYRQMQRQDLV